MRHIKTLVVATAAFSFLTKAMGDIMMKYAKRAQSVK
jgi:hypothetical protein